MMHDASEREGVGMRNILAIGLCAAMALAVPASAMAQGGGHGSHGGHGTMHATPDNTEAVAVGVINSVDTAGGNINITHEPVEALGWPKMTMDLPVTRQVDLASVKAGSQVKVTLKQGRDKQFRVIAIEPHK
jgi:Cu(I)/Ag(I) efflux system periplasmic protein CusF